jgi:5-methylthioadenosine/S-adenosylhomocysteine deaminase
LSARASKGQAARRREADLIVTGRALLTLDAAGTVFEDGALAVTAGRIEAAGTKADIEARFTARERIDEPGCVIMPGLINGHTHVAMTLFRGLADDLPLMEWLTGHIFPAERKLTRQAVRAGALLGMAEMILSGTTSFLDMYLFADQVAEAAEEAKLRAIVGEVLYDFDSPNYGPPDNGLKFTEDLIAHWRGHDLVQIAVEPHALYTCSAKLLQEASDIARREGCRLHLHAAETKDEVHQVVRRFGGRPLRVLAELGLLGSHLILAHCVALSEEDIEMMALSRTAAVHCPQSNLKLASGVAPLPLMLSAGVRLALGTDGPASGNTLDMLAEMDCAAKIHKVVTKDPTAVPARVALRLATSGGAEALGLDTVGSLEAGKRADFILVDFDQPHLTPVYSYESHLAYAARGADVVLTAVDGRILARRGQLTTLDLEEVMAKAREAAAALRR